MQLTAHGSPLDMQPNQPRQMLRILAFALAAALLCVMPVNSSAKEPKFAWTKFVQVAGQPEPVPEQWVSTPEGRFAHSIKIPNPVAKDSGYRWWMTSEQYFEHLCRTEAGEFIFKTVENVEGFYFMRPPKRPTDDDLMDRYKLEAPEIERTFQLREPTPEDRAKTFVNPPWAKYLFVEEPDRSARGADKLRYLRIHGFRQRASPMEVNATQLLASKYGLTWRGVKRRQDREHAIAGSEWFVIDVASAQVLGVQRNFARTGGTRNTPEGIWWLNAINCPNSMSRDNLSRRFYEFVSRVLTPKQEVQQ